MFKKSNDNFMILFAGVLGMFLVGGLLTTLLPAITEGSWRKAVKGHKDYTPAQRRKIEADLVSGELFGVVSTSAGDMFLGALVPGRFERIGQAEVGHN